LLAPRVGVGEDERVLPTPVVPPSRDDPVVRGASELVGGPVGRHAALGRHWFWTPMRVVLALTLLTFGLGYLQKAPCRSRGFGENNFYAYSRLCYTDVYALYYAEGLHEGKVPYVDHPVEYPAVIGGVMHVANEATEAVSDEGEANPRAFFDITAFLLGLCALVVAATTLKLSGRRPWDAALVALAPGLFFHGTTNWDLVATALAGVGLLLWARRRPAAAGVLLGVAAATKLYPAFFFLPLLVLAVRARRVREWAVSAACGFTAFAALNAVVYLVAGSFDWDDDGRTRNALFRFYEGNQDRGADWDSLFFLVEQLMKRLTDNAAWAFPTTGANGDVITLNLLVAITTMLAVVGVCLLAALAPRRPRVGQVLFLTVAGFLLANKVNSPQFTIWLIPLAVMARPRWGRFLAWQAAELLVVFTRFYFFLSFDDNRGIGVGWFLGAVVIRDALLVWLMAGVIREMWRPERDAVRADGVDDPAGGVLVDPPPRTGPRLLGATASA
jgi:uncharacterized membrane protein